VRDSIRASAEDVLRNLGLTSSIDRDGRMLANVSNTHCPIKNKIKEDLIIATVQRLQKTEDAEMLPGFYSLATISYTIA
jgi:hypothetical protein